MLLLALSLAACSGVKERREAYRHAVEPPLLEVPPPLRQPQSTGALVLPEPLGADERGEVELAASGIVASAANEPGSLADISGVRLARDGALRWLVVEATAEQTWLSVKDYLNRYGPPLKREHEAFMTLETDWVAPPAGTERRSMLRKLFGRLYSSGTREKFRIRLAAGGEPGTTEVHVAQQRMQQQAVDDSVRWLPAQADPEREIDVLMQLMVHFGADEQQAERMLAQPVDVVTTIKRDERPPYLSITAPLSWAWPRLGLALDRADAAVLSSDAQAAEYRVVFPLAMEDDDDDLLAFGRRKKVTNLSLRIVLEEAQGGTRVDVRGDAGETVDEDVAERVLKILRKQL